MAIFKELVESAKEQKSASRRFSHLHYYYASPELQFVAFRDNYHKRVILLHSSLDVFITDSFHLDQNLVLQSRASSIVYTKGECSPTNEAEATTLLQLFQLLRILPCMKANLEINTKDQDIWVFTHSALLYFFDYLGDPRWIKRMQKRVQINTPFNVSVKNYVFIEPKRNVLI